MVGEGYLTEVSAARNVEASVNIDRVMSAAVNVEGGARLK